VRGRQEAFGAVVERNELALEGEAKVAPADDQHAFSIADLMDDMSEESRLDVIAATDLQPLDCAAWQYRGHNGAMLVDGHDDVGLVALLPAVHFGTSGSRP